MTKFVKGIFIYSLLIICVPAFAEKKPKFGDIKPADFSPKVYSIDSSANAVVLFDYGSSVYEGDAGGFAIIYNRHKRIRLLNRNSFDLATVSLSLYSNGNYDEKIVSLEACTYNLENGKVETFKLDKASIFKDKLDKNFSLRKFTLPNLKEGSIIEFKYTLSSPYERYLRPWAFQTSYPVLWSEYEVTIPTVYDFTVVSTGYQPYVVNEGKSGEEHYNIRVSGGNASDREDVINYKSTTVIHKWAMKEVPALKEEDFTTSIENHLSKIVFQLSKVSFPNTPSENLIRTWYTVSDDLLKNENFGMGLTRNNGWLQDELKRITAGSATPLIAAKKIFEYVRDNITCTDHEAVYLSNPIKKVFQNKNGNVADVNLLLTACLINQGFKAAPVLLSTRSNGKVTESYPVMSQMNYVLSEVNIDGKEYLLDASHNKLGFGKLNLECYNGGVRVIDKDLPKLINLSPDSLAEYKVTNAFFVNDPELGFAGDVSTTYGEHESNRIREKVAKSGKEDFIKQLKKSFSSDVTITDAKIDSLKIYDEPVSVKYTMTFETKEDMLYVNPIFSEAKHDNPFKAAERLYPVEMPFKMNENYILRMEIPKGYKVEELPKSAKVNFNEDEGSFEYLISRDENVVQLRSTIKMNRAIFLTEDYQTLRQFFGFVVKKHSEQIVFKKIK